MANQIPASLKLPEQGQQVELRQRKWITVEIQAAEFASNPTSTSDTTGKQHLVTLSSVEDDTLGEEIQIVWEIEGGAKVFEKAELPAPNGFDSPVLLDAFLDAVRWGAASTTDSATLQAPFRSGIEVEDYQLDPLVRAVQMPRVNLLIADAVGLGKTIEAGLVCQELIFRHLVRRVLIVCPSSLQIQWQEEMRDRFGMDFRIVDSELMKHLRRTRGIYANPWSHFPRLITSIDFLKRDRPLRLFGELLPKENESPFPRRFDLLIVDEAHNIAPSGVGRYATDSKRTAAVRRLEPHFEHKLFLTATPHNGYSESFTALLEMLDAQRFARGIQPDKRQLNAVMIRRLKNEITDWRGELKFPQRQLDYLRVNYSQAEKEAHAHLQKYTELRLKSARRESSVYAAEFVLKLLKKRLFSSPAAFAVTLEKHLETIAGTKHRETESQAKIGFLRQQFDDRLDEDFADDELFGEALTETVVQASRLLPEMSVEEKEHLEWLRGWAALYAHQPDAKALTLINWLKENLKPGGKWSDERVIIFTEYRDSQKWLTELFIKHGLADDDRLLTLYGGIEPEARERIKAAFQADAVSSDARILLSTDAASEGVNLQNHCSKLVHYEIPWNPNRLEQRNGRIDRYGQRAKAVNVFHFVGANFDESASLIGAKPGELDGDFEFLARAVQKVHTIREDLGKVGQVIAEQVELAMLGKITRLDTEHEERKSQSVKQLLKFEIDVRKQVARFREQLQATKKNLRLSAENVEMVVRTGLELAGQPALIAVPDKPKEFRLPALTKSWAICAEGLEHPHTKEIRPITFDQAVAKERDDVVLAHLNHRLVQMCLRLLRAEIWASETTRKLFRVTARVVPNQALDTPAVIAHGRVVIVGDDKHRLHEEIIAAGGALREGRLERFNVGQTSALLREAKPDAVPPGLQTQLAALWEKISKPLLTALQARADERTKSLEKSLQERAETEIAKLTEVLNELRENISRELDAPAQETQFELFTTPEREQLERNLDNLRFRLAAIPGEIEREAHGIKQRFSNPRPLLFPLAVTFLVPEKLV